MFVSVYMTVKNGENLVGSSIDSVINQTYNKWELIIVDDGSEDNTINVLKSYAEKYPTKIKLIKSGGIGRSKALNLALYHISDCSTHLCNLDSDDIFHPEKLEIQIKFIKDHDFITNDSVKFTDNIELKDWMARSIPKSSKVSEIKNLWVANKISHSSVMFNRRVVDRKQFYNEKLKNNVDYDRWLSSLITGSNFYFYSEKLAAKRIHENQSFENKKRLSYIFNAWKVKRNYLIATDQNTIYKNIIIFSIAIYALLPQKIRMSLSGLKYEKI
ncbi:glycosyltransferase family 2 protein [Vibrio breoganii]